jgi:hypothetical protein
VKEKISIGFDHVERALLPAALDLDPQPRQTEDASRGATTYPFLRERLDVHVLNLIV